MGLLGFDGELAGCGDVVGVVGGDGGTVEVDATVDATAGFVGEVPGEGLRESEVGACALLTGPNAASH